jgi:hypothetical protein
MATLDEYAYNIRNIARSGQGNSDDDLLKIKQVKFWIQYYRAKGIEIQTEMGKNIDPQLVQDLGILALEEVDKTDSVCPAITWGCKIHKVTLPKFASFPKNRAVVFIGKIDKQTPLDYNKADVNKFKAATRFGNLRSKVYLIGNTAYVELIEADADMMYINVRGVLEDPTKADYFPQAGCDAVCFNDATDEYPMPMSLYTYVLENILQKELNWTTKAVNDELNNARQDNQKLG